MASKAVSAAPADALPETEGLPEASTASTSGKQSLWWKIAKFVAGLSVVGSTVGCGYVTYAYKISELQERLDNSRQKLIEANPEGFFSQAKNSVVTALLETAQNYVEVRRNIEDQINGWSAPSSDRLLPDLHPQEQHVITLVLDLNDTLVHSDWKRERGWRTFKRPGVDAFLEHMAHHYEVVVFSDQLNITVDPILDRLDKKGYIRYRLYRDGTLYKDGEYMKDLTKLNRDPAKILYLTGHPEFCLQKHNIVPIPPWAVSDMGDTKLLDLIPFLEYLARHAPQDVRKVLASYDGKDIPTEFRQRSREVMRKQQERKQGGLFKIVRSS